MGTQDVSMEDLTGPTRPAAKKNTFAESIARKVKKPQAALARQTSSGTYQSLEGLFGIGLNFDNLYSLDQRLRSGSFATVFICKHNLTSEEYAVKIIDRTKLKPKDDHAVYREVSILKSLEGHDGVVNLVCFFETHTTFHVVLELARGGDVFDRLAKRTVYTEFDARVLARKLLEGVAHIHSRGIIHRDLKPENLLLVDNVSDTNMKLADFGFARKYEPLKGGLTTRCGTPAFVAPEVLLGVPYDDKVDVWSCGVILYLLLGGYPPFQHENHKGLFRKIRAGDYVFHEKYWDGISIEAKQLVSKLLSVDPESRLNAEGALKSSWFYNTDEQLSANDLNASLKAIRKFNARRKLRGAMHAVTWACTATFWNPSNNNFSKDVLSTYHEMASVDNVAASYKPASDTFSKKSSNSSTASSKVGKTFKDKYTLVKKIRSGSFATVWEGKHNETDIVCAIKVVARKDLKPKDDAQVLNEVAILQSLHHKSIVCLVDFFEEKDNFFIIMELMSGGDVFDRIVEKNHYTELDARNLATELLEAVAFMHSHGVAHRDLKPQNLLLQTKDDDAHIKVADFGFARRVHTPQSLVTRCGTPTYVAPEILKNHPHDTAADMWSVGVILYVLLVGYPPFMEDNQRVLFRKIRYGEYEFFKEDWEEISEEAKDLIQKLLVVDPLHRLTAREALRHYWIVGDNDDMLSSRSLSGSLSELQKSVGQSKLEDAARAVQWMTCACVTLNNKD
mmetsp:Transcript_19139/g.27673  ORF Transcript_19139/g.27673 Transcript_19139/m.27673 type:complete len:733 (+) Transcript_19139:108-2306(+)